MSTIRRPTLKPVDPATPGQHALGLDEAIRIELPGSKDWERSMLTILIAQEWHRVCRHIEDRIAFLARHAHGRCPV